MTQPMLTNLADVLRAAGCKVIEHPAWKTTSRTNDTSRYAAGRPNHLMVHHTASSTLSHSTPARALNEAKQLQLAEPNEPTANLGLDPFENWHVLAAGPTNTNGLGSDWWGGGVPLNSMNSYALAIEIMNNGVGESYAPVESTLVRGCAALVKAYGIPINNIRGHFEWAPTRKIDPAGPSTWTKWEDPNDKWNMDSFRRTIQLAIGVPDTGGETMYLFRGPSGQMYATNRDYRDRPIGFAVNENDGAMLRDVYGYNVGPDTGPWPIDESEERVIRAIAGLGV